MVISKKSISVAKSTIIKIDNIYIYIIQPDLLETTTALGKDGQDAKASRRATCVVRALKVSGVSSPGESVGVSGGSYPQLDDSVHESVFYCCEKQNMTKT